MVEEAFLVEDTLLNETNSNRTFMSTTPIKHNSLYTKLCNPTIGNKKINFFTLILIEAMDFFKSLYKIKPRL